MKRLLLLLPVLAVFLLAQPAGAHTIPDTSITVTCTEVSFHWQNFPVDTPVILQVMISEGDNQTVASVSTNGAPEGDGHVPVSLTDGSAVTVEITWVLGEYPNKVVATRDLDCTPATTVPPTTSPPTTVVPTTTEVPTTVVEPTTALLPPVSFSPAPAELAITGSNTTGLVVGGGLLLSVGVALLFGSPARRGSAE